MPEQNLIDVRILVNGQSLQEFPDTDGQYTGNENVVCYVQAETGQAFEVQVKWLSGYSLRHAPFLRAELKVDGHDTIACYSIKATKLRLKKGSLSKDFKKTFASVIAKNELEQWKRYTFTFGALGLSTNSDYIRVGALAYIVQWIPCRRRIVQNYALFPSLVQLKCRFLEPMELKDWHRTFLQDGYLR